MTAHSDGEDRNQAAWFQPPTDESTFDAGTLTLDLVEDILCRLPVKLLMQLQCVCKSWNSLICNPIFAKKHLRLSRTLSNRHHLISYPEDRRFHLWDSPLHSFFNSSSTCIPRMQLCFPLNVREGSYEVIGSCDGILCISIGIYTNYVMVWNPSISKFKILPPSENQPKLKPNGCFDGQTIYGFGYDRLTENYKVVAFCCYQVGGPVNWICKNVEVHTLGTNVWKTILGLPAFRFGFGFIMSKCGIFLSGTINWLGIVFSPFKKGVIFSFDLGNESYQELLPPDDGGVDVTYMNLGVLRDCLCILSHNWTSIIHVWLMEDYGNKDSWTKLLSVSCDELFIDPNVIYTFCPLYILEDDQLLLDFTDFTKMLAIYNSRNRTLKIPKVQSISGGCKFNNHVYIESLISP